MSNPNQIAYIQELAYKLAIGVANLEEKEYFENWYKNFDDTEVIYSTDQYSDEASLRDRIFQKITEKIKKDRSIEKASRWKTMLKYAAVVTLIFFSTWVVVKEFHPFTGIDSEYALNQIAPGKNLATIKLSNGKTIVLSSTRHCVGLSNGTLHYTDGSAVSNEQLSENLVAATPKGGTYQFVLGDGTKVWLNAASSITFPSNFANNSNRVVLVTGEAYLEVAKDKAHPFIVKTAEQEIKVLGTHFNVNCYADELQEKTTLLEGSIAMHAIATKKGHILVPGDQAILNKDGLNIRQVDTSGIVAWKNGYFKFNDETIENIMRTLSRWYNIEITYQANVQHERFTGRISRYKNIAEVLKLIASDGTIKFKAEGRRIMLTR